MSNLEEDIKFIEEMIKEYKTFGDLHNPDFEDTDRIYKALENMLNRIKELEEENKKKSIENICYQEELENSIPKQKVKDKIEELKETLTHYDEYTRLNLLEKINVDILDSRIEILEELLEEK